jgi:hypothetical protein
MIGLFACTGVRYDTVCWASHDGAGDGVPGVVYVAGPV